MLNDDYYDINMIFPQTEKLFCDQCENAYLECPICNAYFDIEFFYQEHQVKCAIMHEVLQERENIVECGKCLTYFKCEEFESHSSNCVDHNQNNLNMQPEDNVACGVCGLIFSASLLPEHEVTCKEIQAGIMMLQETIQCDFCGEKITMSGIEVHESKCQQLKDKQAQIENRVNSIEIAYPKEWDEQIAFTKVIDENLSIITIDPEGSTFKYIYDLTNMSMRGAVNITNIYRLQNRFLWDKYVREKEKVLVEKGTANEQWLFHGTRANNPKSLYNIGFDISFSSDGGSFGRGIYFARQSAYSLSGYCYVTKGKGYLFLAKVITGVPYVSGASSARGVFGPRSAMKKPPLMDESKFIYYDSVTDVANTKNQHVGQMYIIYENDKAYPYYLIEFDASNIGSHLGLNRGNPFNAYPNQQNKDDVI